MDAFLTSTGLVAVAEIVAKLLAESEEALSRR